MTTTSVSNNAHLIGYDRAAEMMTQTSQRVRLKVAKQGAIYHGLATVLNQQSPIMQRGESGLDNREVSLGSTRETNR